MRKRNFLLLVPLAIIAGILIYCWILFLFTPVVPTWRHYVALLLFVPLIFLYYKQFSRAVLATGIYLIMGTINLLALLPSITTTSYGMRLGSAEIWTPDFQLLPLGILILYSVLNFGTLINIRLDYLDYKQAKKKK